MSVYKYYVEDTGMCKVDVDAPLKDRLMSLSRFLNNMQSRYIESFDRAVRKVPGMKYYLVTHTIFDIETPNSRDWLTRKMASYLTPDDGFIDVMKDMYTVDSDVEEMLKIFNPVATHEYDDEVYIKFGLWMFNDAGRIEDPINIIDTFWDNDFILATNDVHDIIDSQGILDLSTGEIVIDEKDME